ncbi:MAG TPA: hypothetical protein VFC68_07725, partial [Treponemataceae bacterium]|nr:hypothetical protein [Treponemataceae bacterium]
MNKKEKNKFFIPSRVVALCAFFALAASTAMNLICGVDFGSIIPYEAFVITFVNGLCAFLCFILLFIPTYLPLQLSILFLECVFTTLSGYD